MMSSLVLTLKNIFNVQIFMNSVLRTETSNDNLRSLIMNIGLDRGEVGGDDCAWECEQIRSVSWPGLCEHQATTQLPPAPASSDILHLNCRQNISAFIYINFCHSAELCKQMWRCFSILLMRFNPRAVCLSISG